MDGKNLSMRTFFVMSALLLTQLVWLSSLAFASPYANQDDCTSVQSEAHLHRAQLSTPNSKKTKSCITCTSP